MPPTLLLADTDPDSGSVVETYARDHGFQFIWARDGEEAFMRFQSAPPDAALIAVDLPGVLGSVLCQRIKHSARPDTPVILLSAQYQTAALGERACQMFGADAFLATPLDATALRDTLGRFIAEAQTATPAPSEAPGRHEGSLAESPVPRIFIDLYHRHASGILTVERNKMRRVIYFLNGSPVSASSNLRGESPGMMLVRDGILTEETYAACLRDVESGAMSLTEAWVEHSALTPEALYSRLSAYSREVMMAAFAWNEGHYAFTPGNTFRDKIALFEAHPLEIVRHAVAAHYPLRRFMTRVVGVKDKYLCPAARMRADLPFLHLTPDEARIVRHITGANKGASVLAQAGRDLPTAYQLLWLLLEAQLIETADEPRTPVSPELPAAGSGEMSASQELPPPPAALTADIIREYFRIKGADYFQVLHLPPEASLDQIEKAYLDLESKYHPDAYSGYNLGEHQDKLLEILDKIKLAYGVLSDDASRTSYRKHIADRIGSVPQDAALRAEMLFKRGEDELAMGHTAEAEEMFREAIEKNPAEADYYAYLGWTTFKAHPDDPERIRTAKEFMNKALAMNPNSDKALLLLGRLFLEEAKVDMAAQYFQKALDVNPRCTPAQAALEGIERVIARKRERDAHKDDIL